MKKCLITVLIILTILRLFTFRFYEDMYAVEVHELLRTIPSPNNKYELQVYVNHGNATAAELAVIDVISKDGSLNRRIFKGPMPDHGDVETRLQVIWESEDIVNICGHRIDVRKDVYNFSTASKEDRLFIKVENIVIITAYAITILVWYKKKKKSKSISIN